jgi:hypothetical protein
MPNEIATLRAALRTSPEYHRKLHQLFVSGVVQPADLDPTEEITIVAASEHFGMEGAKQARCACGVIVWLSPSTQEMVAARGDVPQPRIACIGCFTKEINAETRPHQ